MLAREYAVAELAQMGAINSAVVADELDAEVEHVVPLCCAARPTRLRGPSGSRTRHVVDQLNRTLDAGVAYELVNMYQVLVEGRDSFVLSSTFSSD